MSIEENNMSIRESHENWQNFEALEQGLNAESQDLQHAAPAPVLPQCESFEGGLGI